MSTRIKGITIEINGDVTKLDKALSQTDKHLSTTQKSLKDIERLLKLDPGNTELLAQKQRLLADAATDTAARLKTLQQAAKNADSALARGQDYEAKYAPLKQEISSVSESLQGLLERQKQMETGLAAGSISTAAYDAFMQTVNDTKTRLNELKQAEKDLKKEFSGGKLNQSQYDALQRELIEAEKAAEEAEEAVKSFNTTAAKFSGVATEIGNKANSLSSASKGISTAAAGILTAAAATVPATEELRASLSMLTTNAEAAGIGIQTTMTAFEQFSVVSNDTNASVEALSNLLQAGVTESNMQKAVENLSGAVIRFPDTLKIESLADGLQETLATGTATGQFAELLDRVGIGAESFSEQLALITSEADRQNFALYTLSQAGLQDSYNSWLQNNQALAENRQATLESQLALSELAETMQPFLTMLVEMGTQVLNFFNELPSGVQTTIIILLALVAAISPLAGLVSAAATAMGAAGIAMSSWLPIIAAVAAALVGLAAIIAMITGKTDDIANVAGSITGSRGTGFAAGAGARGYTLSADVPALAQGTVARANHPFLAVIGDNTQEEEIVAPYSTVKRAAAEALAESRGSRIRYININMTLGGVVVGRKLVPYVDQEYARQGPNLVK